jgi:hypothetical protein
MPVFTGGGVRSTATLTGGVGHVVDAEGTPTAPLAYTY